MQSQKILEALKFHHSSEQDILLAISKGMWVTKMSIQVEENDLVRNARKQLERARIISIQQLDSRRIAILKSNIVIIKSNI